MSNETRTELDSALIQLINVAVEQEVTRRIARALPTGAFLSDRDICELMQRTEDPLVVDPVDPFCFTTNGIDLRVSNYFEVAKAKDIQNPIDMIRGNITYEEHSVPYGKPIVVGNQQLLILRSLATVKMPRDHMGFLTARTKGGRSAYNIEVYGTVEAGYEGTLMIRASAAGPHPVTIWPLARMAHMLIARLSSPVERDYAQRSGKYLGSGQKAKPDTAFETECILNGDIESLRRYVPRDVTNDKH